MVLNGVLPENRVLKPTINRVTKSGKFPGPFTLFVERFHQTSTLFDDTVNEIHVMTFSSIKVATETYNFHQEIQEDDRSEFLDAMTKISMTIWSENIGNCSYDMTYRQVQTRSGKHGPSK